MKTNIALYFGSFNPVHFGHLAIANHLVENNLCNEVWFVVSPQNPLKETIDLAPAHHRVEMLKLATKKQKNISVSDIELTMLTPSYTIHTLEKLSLMHPDTIFSIVTGMDNLLAFKKWKQWEEILNNHILFIYPRENTKQHAKQTIKHNNIHILHDAPLLNYSSTTIRNNIQNKNDISQFVPKAVAKYIIEYQLYK